MGEEGSRVFCESHFPKAKPRGWGGSQLLAVEFPMFPGSTQLVHTHRLCFGKEQQGRRLQWNPLPGEISSSWGSSICLARPGNKSDMGPGAAAAVTEPGGRANCNTPSSVTAKVPLPGHARAWRGAQFLEAVSLFLQLSQEYCGFFSLLFLAKSTIINYLHTVSHLQLITWSDPGYPILIKACPRVCIKAMMYFYVQEWNQIKTKPNQQKEWSLDIHTRLA